MSELATSLSSTGLGPTLGPTTASISPIWQVVGYTTNNLAATTPCRFVPVPAVMPASDVGIDVSTVTELSSPVHTSTRLFAETAADAVQSLVSATTKIISARTSVHGEMLISLDKIKFSGKSNAPTQTLTQVIAGVVPTLTATTTDLVLETPTHGSVFETADKKRVSESIATNGTFTLTLIADAIAAAAVTIKTISGTISHAPSEVKRALMSLQEFLDVLVVVQASAMYKTVANAFDFWLKAQVVHLVTGGLGGFPRRFSDVLNYWLNRVALAVSYRNTDPLFDHISAWMVSQREWNSQKAYYASAEQLGRQKIEVANRLLPGFNRGEDEAKTSEAKLTPALDVDYVLPFEGYRLTIRKALVQRTEGMLDVYEYKITFPRNLKLVEDFHRAAKRSYSPFSRDELVIYNCPGDSRQWFPLTDDRNPIPKRSIKSVHLAGGIKEQLIKDIEEFLGDEEIYGSRSLPWHRGYLLHGPPGTGKTSVVKALASHFDLRIHLLQPNPQMGDGLLSFLVRRIPAKSILLIEDIDRAFPAATTGGNQSETSGPTLGGLLNTLDGVGSGKGLITFMTTNNKKNIDKALLRPGRIARLFELGYATKDTTKQLFKQFYSVGTTKTKKEVEVLAARFADQLTDNLTMAELANFLSFPENSRDPEEAVKSLSEWLNKYRGTGVDEGEGIKRGQ